MRQIRIRSILMYVFAIVALLSCYEIKKGNEMIEYISEKFEKHKPELKDIVAWIEEESIYPKSFIEVDSSIIEIYNWEENTVSYLEDKTIEQFLIKFYKDFEIYRIEVNPETISFNAKMRNPDLWTYSLEYARTPSPKTFANYKIYSGENKPKESTGWLYKLEENWYLESRASSD